MINEPPESGRRVHPLENPAVRPAPTTDDAPRTKVTLHIASVKPYVTWALVGVMVIIFLVRAINPAWDEALFLAFANRQSDVFRNGEFYRLFTSMFLHASIQGGLGNSLHLIFNAYILWSSGSQLESMFGHLRFWLIFLLGGLTGSIASALLGGNIYSVGASGAVFAVLGAQFVFLYKHRKLLGAAGRSQMRSLITLGAMNLALGLISSLSPSGGRIDNWAHLGGAVGGLALAWVISPFYLVRRHPMIPTDLLGEDSNPLIRRTTALSLYAAGLVVLLIVGSMLLRGNTPVL